MERIRQIVKTTVPEAVELISYDMPGFKYRGKYLLGYAAFTHHLSLFPTPRPIELMAGQLAGYKTSKGTIQFTLETPLSEELIRQIVRLRRDNIDSK